MGQREYWEKRICDAYGKRLHAVKQVAAKQRDEQVAKLARELKIDKDLETLDQMEALERTLLERIEKAALDRGVQCWSYDPRDFLAAIVSQQSPAVELPIQQERDDLLSRLHRACGPTELRVAVSAIERELAGLEEQSQNSQPAKR